MKTLIVQFSDGQIFYNGFDYYYSEVISFKEEGVDTYKVGTILDGYFYSITNLMSILGSDRCRYLKPKDSNFFYPKTSVVKFAEVEESDLKNWIRDNQINQILK